MLTSEGPLTSCHDILPQHPGTKGFAAAAVIGKQQIGPSATFSPANIWFNKKMTEEDLDKVASDFAQSAKIAKEVLDFDAVELHCGHGFVRKY